MISPVVKYTQKAHTKLLYNQKTDQFGRFQTRTHLFGKCLFLPSVNLEGE